MKLVRYSGDSEWSALYVDGVLDRVGDHYHIDERISSLMGVANCCKIKTQRVTDKGIKTLKLVEY